MLGVRLRAPRGRGVGVTLGLVLLMRAADVGRPNPVPAHLGARPVINGAEDFAHPAAGAIMVYDPNHSEMPGWRPFCGAALVHERVLQTAGHCIQFLEQQLESGRARAAWVSFQQDPLAHFDADPDVEDPASGGWHQIESLHVNPDNVDFVALRQADSADVRAVWGTFHDSGAIVLMETVLGVEPMGVAVGAGEVDGLLRDADCEGGDPACNLLIVAYGLAEFPVVTVPPVLVRRAARLRYKGIDSMFVSTFDALPGSEFGATCPGDSGSPVILQTADGEDRIVIAISSSPADPFGAPCASGGLQYRVDTESHRALISGVIEAVERR